jgi:signal peptidase
MRMENLQHQGKRTVLVVSNIATSHLNKRRQLIVTKGDNNEVDDVPMYPDGQAFVTRAEIMGLVVAYVPYLGWVSIALQKVFETKYLVLLVVIAVSLAS